MKQMQIKIIYFLFLLLFLFGFSHAFYIPTYPGFFLFGTIAWGLFVIYLIRRLWWQEHLNFYSLKTLGIWGIYFIWLVFTLLWSNEYILHIDSLLRWSMFLTFLWGSYELIQRNRQICLWIWPISLVPINLIALSYLGRALVYSSQNTFGFFLGNPNIVGSVLGFGCVLSIILSIGSWKQKKYRIACLYLLSFLILMMGLIICSAKAAIFSSLIAIFIYSYLNFPKNRSYMWLIVILFSFIIWQFRSNIIEKIWPSLEIRLLIWQDTWQIICSDPFRFLFGWGIGNFIITFANQASPNVFSGYYTADLIESCHNFFLEIWLETGLIGLLIFLSAIFYTIRIAYKNILQKKISDSLDIQTWALISGLIMLLLDSQFSISLTHVYGQYFFCLLLAWLTVISQKEQNDIPNKIPEKNTLLKLRQCTRAFAIVLIIMIFGWAWKISLFDFGRFYYSYRTSFFTNTLGMRAQFMSVIPETKYENLFTLTFRLNFGAILNDLYLENPDWVKANLSRFLWLNKIPKLGSYKLYQGIFLAKSAEITAAVQSLESFSKKNPFLPSLWIFWSFICKEQNADVAIMKKYAKEYSAQYPHHPSITLGLALAFHVEGDRKNAQSMIQQAKMQSKSRLQKCQNPRDQFILEYAESYLKAAANTEVKKIETFVATKPESNIKQEILKKEEDKNKQEQDKSSQQPFLNEAVFTHTQLTPTSQNILSPPLHSLTFESWQFQKEGTKTIWQNSGICNFSDGTLLEIAIFRCHPLGEVTITRNLIEVQQGKFSFQAALGNYILPGKYKAVISFIPNIQKGNSKKSNLQYEDIMTARFQVTDPSAPKFQEFSNYFNYDMDNYVACYERNRDKMISSLNKIHDLFLLLERDYEDSKRSGQLQRWNYGSKYRISLWQKLKNDYNEYSRHFESRFFQRYIDIYPLLNLLEDMENDAPNLLSEAQPSIRSSRFFADFQSRYLETETFFSYELLQLSLNPSIALIQEVGKYIKGFPEPWQKIAAIPMATMTKEDITAGLEFFPKVEILFTQSQSLLNRNSNFTSESAEWYLSVRKFANSILCWSSPWQQQQDYFYTIISLMFEWLKLAQVFYQKPPESLEIQSILSEIKETLEKNNFVSDNNKNLDVVDSSEQIKKLHNSIKWKFCCQIAVENLQQIWLKSHKKDIEDGVQNPIIEDNSNTDHIDQFHRRNNLQVMVELENEQNPTRNITIILEQQQAMQRFWTTNFQKLIPQQQKFLDEYQILCTEMISYYSEEILGIKNDKIFEQYTAISNKLKDISKLLQE